MRQTWTVALACLVFLTLVPVGVQGLTFDHRLPDRVSVGEAYRDVRVNITDDGHEYDGVCEVTLSLGDANGDPIDELDRIDASCEWEEETADGTPYQEFRLTFQIGEEQVDREQQYTLVTRFGMHWADQVLNRTYTHAIQLNPRLEARFDVEVDGLEVSADANPSYTDDNPELQFAWNWGDGYPVHFVRAPTATHTYEREGRFTITLEVRDSFGQRDTAREIVGVEANEEAESPGSAWLWVVAAAAAVPLARRGRTA